MEMTVTTGKTYLRVQLTTNNLVGFALNQTSEVIMIPSRRLAAMPNLPECVLGLVNHRNRILWTVDLAALLGFSPLDAFCPLYPAVVVRNAHRSLAFAVREVNGIWHTDAEVLPPPKTVPDYLLPYLAGVVHQSPETLLLIDPVALLHSSDFLLRKN
ncbi:MAG: chemotaxis protein CheW [Anaerolineae bacterium]|nr:chemotaxis protein CheW [Gloeobacterales cyanobacterium ES-bin-313]